MARWRQTKDEHGKNILVPIDEAARERDGVAIQGDFEPFISPIDRTVISGRKQYREHCEKHNVVPAQEFDTAYYHRKAVERRKALEGEHSTEETFRRKQEIYDLIIRAERGLPLK